MMRPEMWSSTAAAPGRQVRSPRTSEHDRLAVVH
jgi:hypothetical protein